MPLEPRELDIPKIPGALRFYIVMSFITGTFLLLLVLEMIVRYGFGYDLEIAGPFGFVHLTPHEQVTAINGSTGILIIHGWLYVIYLIASFRIWAFMRWSFVTLIVLALGGIIPALSFILEAIYAKRVRAWLTAHSAANPVVKGA